MALTPLWCGGESPQTAASASTGEEGGQQNTAWERETTIVAGAWSLASYKANLDVAAESSIVTPSGKDGAVLSATQTQLGTTFALYMTDTTPADSVIIMSLTAVSTPATATTTLVHQVDGDLELTDSSGTVDATATTPFSANTWMYFRVTCEYDSGADSLRWRMWKWASTNPRDGSGWGSTIIDYTETTSGVATGLQRLNFSATANSKGVAPNTTYYFDDMFEFSFTADADLPIAPATVQALRPNANGTNSAFTSGTGTNPDYTDVDEVTSDGGTTTDVSPTTAATYKQTYAVEASPTLTDADRAVYVEAISRTILAGGAGGTTRVLVLENGTTTDSGTNGNSSTTDYHSNVWMMATTPSSSAAWTQTLIDSMEVGCQRGGLAGRSVTLTQTFALVVRITAPVSLALPRRPIQNLLVTR